MTSVWMADDRAGASSWRSRGRRLHGTRRIGVKLWRSRSDQPVMLWVWLSVSVAVSFSLNVNYGLRGSATQAIGGILTLIGVALLGFAFWHWGWKFGAASIAGWIVFMALTHGLCLRIAWRLRGYSDADIADWTQPQHRDAA